MKTERSHAPQELRRVSLVCLVCLVGLIHVHPFRWAVVWAAGRTARILNPSDRPLGRAGGGLSSQGLKSLPLAGKRLAALMVPESIDKSTQSVHSVYKIRWLASSE